MSSLSSDGPGVGTDQPDVRPEDAIQVAQRALQKVNELEGDLEAHQDETDKLRERLVELELRLSEIDDNRDYESLTLDEKIGMVREYAYQKARDGHGKTTLDYDDIMWSVFDGEPGAKHCYKLIRRAAGLCDDRRTGSEVPGFRARDPDGDAYHLAVDAEQAQRGAAFFPENKTSSEGVR